MPVTGSGSASRSPLLLLDHLTAIAADPLTLVTIAAEEGYAGICLFLRPMRALPDLPTFRLAGDAHAARALGDRAAASGVAIDMAYPFSLAGEPPAAHDVLLDTAATVGARSVNILCFVDDPVQQVDAVAAFADHARSFGLAARLEFYPASSVRSLAQAVDLLDRAGNDDLTLTCDLLHLRRTGGSVADVQAAASRIGLLQLCDGPAIYGGADPIVEASADRRLPGDGVFDVAATAAVCLPGTAMSIESPLRTGGSPRDRARAAREATLRCLAERPVPPPVAMGGHEGER